MRGDDLRVIAAYLNHRVRMKPHCQEFLLYNQSRPAEIQRRLLSLPWRLEPHPSTWCSTEALMSPFGIEEFGLPMPPAADPPPDRGGD